MTDVSVSNASPNSGMPKVVWIPLAMMLIQVPIGLISVLFFKPAEIALIPPVLMVIGFVAALGLISLLGFGYGWVRHLYAVSAVLSLPHLISDLPQRLHSAPVSGTWVLASNLWFYAALVLLYSSGARTWFHDARTRRQRGL